MANHTFNVTLAERYGIESAILIEHIYWWIHKNECDKAEGMERDGRWWCRSTAKGFAKYIPYLKPDKIWRILRKMEGHILLVGNFNTKVLNQTLWYSFTDEFEKELQKLDYDFEKFKNADLKNEKSYKEDNIKEDNKKENSVSDDTLKKGAADELFDKFWEAYGKKVRKEEAIREWSKLSADNRQKALDAIEAYKESKRYETRYMLDPVRYLKRKTWNDDFSTVNRKTFYDPQEGDSDEKQRFKVWMRKTYPEIEKTDFPISYEDYIMLKGKYGVQQLGEQLAYINENITRFRHRDVTWEIDNFLRGNEED